MNNLIVFTTVNQELYNVALKLNREVNPRGPERIRITRHIVASGHDEHELREIVSALSHSQRKIH